MAINDKIFGDKTISDMFSDVYKNTERKRQQIDEFIKSYLKLIKTPEDAAMLGPVLKDLLEVNVKNDEHIVRLVQIAQRLVSVNSKSDDNGQMLTEAEKEQLLNAVKADFESAIKSAEEVEDEIQSLRQD